MDVMVNSKIDSLEYQDKQCNFCSEVKEINNFYSYKRKGKETIFYMSKCKLCHRAFQKKYNKNTKYFRKDNATRCKEYRENHPERYREQKRIYIARKRKEDKAFLIQDRISTQVYQFCKRLNLEKTNSFWYSINYTPEQLVKHLERNFWYGMDWGNYGDWHIDHIKPKSKYTINEYGDEQFMECWGLSNLQPLWAEDNLIKGNQYRKYNEKR
tara:strand:+ start:13 stop:648 length:636 start_codon:yes stop_codon:yes gene_type:complete